MNDLDLTRETEVDMRVSVAPVPLGNYLAEQDSDAQASVLWGFAAYLYGMGSPTWEHQCAFIRESWNESQREVVALVLGELLAVSS